jgi:hypothetical protein
MSEFTRKDSLIGEVITDEAYEKVDKLVKEFFPKFWKDVEAGVYNQQDVDDFYLNLIIYAEKEISEFKED